MTGLVRLVFGLALGSLLLAPLGVSAQTVTTGSIAGIVRDATGAMLPGVTVEAASPALIEKVRSVVTDTQGNYKIIELRPGTYTVTFTLPGFSVYRREGIELTTGFTANITGELKVGSLAETVTVTGVSPVVDVQNVRQQNVITRDVLDAIPTARGPQALAALTLGARGGTDVGGTSARNAQSMSVHGSHMTDLKYNLDGMSYNTSHGGGGIAYYYNLNHVGVQEITLQTDGFNAETETGGVQVNAVPRDGGNRFSFFGTAEYADDRMNSDNVSAKLRARRLGEQAGTKQVYDYGIGVGGPIMRDRLWFYSPNRWLGSARYTLGSYLNTSPNPLLFQAGPPTYAQETIYDNGIRLTWQVSARHKVTVSENFQDRWSRTKPIEDQTAAASVIATSTPTSESRWGGLHLMQTTWTHPRTSRLLFEGGFSLGYFPRDSNVGPYVLDNAVSIRSLNPPLTYGASTEYFKKQAAHNLSQRASMSYVTGSHAIKVGLQLQEGIENWNTRTLDDTDWSFTFSGISPVAVTLYARPEVMRLRSRGVGVYAQDQWSMRRLALSYGLRFDHAYGYTLAEDLPAGRFVGPRHYEARNGVPDLTDLSPRVGAAYDLFGNGKTALKVSVGRAVMGTMAGTNIPRSVHPGSSASLVATDTRTWTDSGNYVPDCNFRIPAANGECGPSTALAFGTSREPVAYADDYLGGFGNRQYTWRYAAVLQQELRPGVGMTVGYYRTQYGNFSVRENRAVTPADFTPFCITAPADLRLPGGGGNQVCGFWDVSPAQRGRNDDIIRPADDFDISQRFDGFDVGINGRLPRGYVQGGISTGQFRHEACSGLDRPNVRQFILDPFGFSTREVEKRPGVCAETSPWGSNTQFKIAGSYSLLWGIDASANFQYLPGVQNSAYLTLTGAQLALPSVSTLGRAGSAAVYTGTTGATPGFRLTAPYTMFEDRLSQLDVRLAKTFTVRGTRVKGMFDVYNALNANTVLATTSTYGAAWLRPTSILAPRLFKVGAAVSF